MSKTTTPDTPVYLSGKAAADYLGLDATAVVQGYKRGTIRAAAHYESKSGKVPLFLRSELDLYQSKHPKTGARLMREVLEKLAAEGNEEARAALAAAVVVGRRKTVTA